MQKACCNKRCKRIFSFNTPFLLNTHIKLKFVLTLFYKKKKDRTFYCFTALITLLGCCEHWESLKIAFLRLVINKFFMCSPNILHGYYHGGKPIESVVYCNILYYYRTQESVSPSNVTDFNELLGKVA